MDLSIVIAHRGDALGLWATVQSCEIDLANSGLSHNYHIVSNGDGKPNSDLTRIVHFLGKSGRLGGHEHFDEPLAPPTARQIGTCSASGKYLFFLDNHCLVARDYFKRAVLDFEHYSMDMLHSTTKFYEGEFTHYHYRLKLAHNFWGDSAPFPQHALMPYRIAASGHGGFAVRRDVWEEVGGYGPKDLFVGYGGEEMYFDLKMALLGKTNWLDPRVVHYHYAGKRGYSRHYTDDYYRNMMQCAFMIGGHEWLYRVYESFLKSPKQLSNKTMFDLLTDAEERGREHAAHIASIRTKTLDEALEEFVRNQIATN